MNLLSSSCGNGSVAMLYKALRDGVPDLQVIYCHTGWAAEWWPDRVAAKQSLREICLPGGLCVTIEPTLFIFAGGEENGFVVGLLNYPRFPVSVEHLTRQARDVMHRLLDAVHQHSALMVTPETSEWITKREG